MIGEQKTGLLKNVILSAVAHEPIKAATPEGKSAVLAVIDQHGNILAAGDDVANEVRAIAINCYRNFLKGEGYLRVFSQQPPAARTSAAA